MSAPRYDWADVYDVVIFGGRTCQSLADAYGVQPKTLARLAGRISNRREGAEREKYRRLANRLEQQANFVIT